MRLYPYDICRNQRHVLVATIVLLAFLLSPCVTAARAASISADKAYSPVRLKVRMSPEPVRLAWSPDGATLAVATDDILLLYSLTEGKLQKTSVEKPFALLWVDASTLAVLLRTGDIAELVIYDLAASELKERSRLALSPHATSLFPFGADKVGIGFARFAPIRIGIDSYHTLRSVPLHFLGANVTVREVFHTNRILGKHSPAPSVTTGWLQGGASWLARSVLLLEYIDPPALIPYMKLSTVDYVTGLKRELLRYNDGRFLKYGSWSPRGDRFALSTDASELRVISLDGEVTAVDNEVKGLSPVWNPRGSQIYFGGAILDRGGKASKSIVANAEQTTAAWHPDGTSIAVASQDTVLILSGVTLPEFLPEDVPVSPENIRKIDQLRNLLDEGLITESEFRTRTRRLSALAIPSAATMPAVNSDAPAQNITGQPGGHD